MSTLAILPVPILSDNYAWLLHDAASGTTSVVDPGEAAGVAAALKARGWRLSSILLTHHHGDHVAGAAELAAAAGGVPVIGPEKDRPRVPAITAGVAEGGRVRVGTAEAAVHEAPGHTAHHIVFHFAAEAALMAGDVLFSLGCGRPIEGTAAQLWRSIHRLRDMLPDETILCCGHEYTADNARFALSVDPDNAALKARAAEVAALRAAGKPTLPVRLGDERKANPFLRADDSALAARLGLAGADPADLFTHLREAKNKFR